MKFVSFPLNKFFYCESHLLDKVPVKLTVEVITLILIYTFNTSVPALLAKVLLDNSDDGLLHLFLHNVIFSRSVDFIEELFLALFEGVLALFLTALTVSLLLLEFRSKKIVVLFSQRFYSKSDLLLKVVSRVLRERPPDKLLNWDDILR